MNKENYNNIIFYSDSQINRAKEIQAFYESKDINIEFRSITSYLNFKSYTFVKNESTHLSHIKEFLFELTHHLNLKVIRVVSDNDTHISFELHNKKSKVYNFLTAIEDEKFQNPQEMQLPVLLGERKGAFVIDLAKTPHLLIGGSTGSGKSVFINSLLLSLLYHHSPETLKLVLIDPKVVEFSIYNDIPHLLYPVITDQHYVNSALAWCIEEMERRYELLSKAMVRNIEQYNDKVKSSEKLPYIVVIIDEFADLMLSKHKDKFEELVVRLARKARATNIHLIMAAQRLTYDVITDVIKANIPSRIAFTVATEPGSRLILDNEGAECLIGLGDFLFLGAGATKPIRLQAPLLSDDDVARITDELRKQGHSKYIDLSKYLPPKEEIQYSDSELDPLFDEAVQFIRETNILYTSAMQRHFRIEFKRAAVIMDQLEQKGIVSAMNNGKRTLL
ncbi:hypothetical protein B0186_06040 [Canicola haemoglobinophilus]|uniref:DNA translocase FtsK n=1 Tax=Canicola haemoglobinophilus TaxID=733 RepID=A0A1V4B0Y2_9PAST|nr:FtsK/SpoIIIE domain-containing protein [Canicola haemoglobinophilus]OOS00401.1 hypothetical protein B0186_06040 [Canicola haemoglobinophilus]STO59434.1 DNA translocase FtsK [Canicola haemoglobinophilus]